MANITTRNLTSTTVTSSNLNKGSSLTHNELDSNFLNLNNEKIDVLNPDIQGDLKIAGTSSSTVGNLVLKEASDNGVHRISIKAPTTLAANVAFTLPDNDGNANEVLITDGSGALSWSATYAGDITEVVAGTHLSGGGASGSVTLNLDTSALSINALSDVDTTGVANNKILKYNSSTSKFEIADDSGSTFVGLTDTPANFTSAGSKFVKVNSGASALEFVAVSPLENLSEDTSPQLGGSLDVLDKTITSSSANITISADTTDKEIHFKVDDAGGTSQTAGEFRDYSYTENATDGNSGTAATKYKPVLDLPGMGLRIGSSAANFSSTGAAGNNNTAAYNQTGVLITNGDEPFWPTLNITNYGGENPLLNQLGSSAIGGAAVNFTSPAVSLGAAGGTLSSPAALPSSKRLGQIAFTGHDGTGFGGASAIASASITVTSTETFSSSNARGAKMEFDITKTGGAAGDGDATSDRRHQMIIDGDTVQIGNENHDNKYLILDSGTGKLRLKDIKITTEGTNEDLDIEPNGTGQVHINTNIIEQHNANGLVIHNGNQGTHNGANFGAPEGDSSGSSMLFNTGIQVEGNGQYEYPALVLKNNSINGYNNLWAAKARPTSGSDYNDDTYLQDDDVIFRFFGAGYQGDDGAGNGVFSYGSATVDLYASEDHSSSANGGGFRVKTLNTGTAAASNAETEKFRIEDDVRVNPAGLNVDFRVHGENTDNVIRLDASKDKLQMNGVFRLHQASSDPSSNLENGDMYYNTSTHKFRGYANGAWVDLH